MKTVLKVALSFAALAAPLTLSAEELSDKEKEMMNSIMEKLKPQIEAEVQRRVKEELQKVEAARTSAPPATAQAPTPVPVPVTESKPWSPSQPIPLFRAGNAYLNLGVVADVVIGGSTTPDIETIEGGHHDPAQRGFNLTGAELSLEGAVDPYFKGQTAISLVIEPGGETVVELEEAWLQTTSLPWGLQFKAGEILADFGRQNPQHNHTWSFVDQPIVSTRLFGPDGLRNPGARVSWLMPTPFYSELMLAVFNSDGETAYSFDSDDSVDITGGTPVDRSLRGMQDLLYVPRLAVSFDLGDTQTLLLGSSAALGPNNSGTHAYTQIYGGDLYWKWKPTNAHAGWPFVSWQTEFLYRIYEAAKRTEDGSAPPVTLPEEDLHDWGFYSQLLWGFHHRWVAGVRGEYSTGDDASFKSDLRNDRTRVSPNLTFHPTEYSKLRLQYNYDHIQSMGDEHSVWLQLEFLLGAHAAHKF
jgi:hypothetical protein